jgi:hypothetical protein
MTAKYRSIGAEFSAALDLLTIKAVPVIRCLVNILPPAFGPSAMLAPKAPTF